MSEEIRIIQGDCRQIIPSLGLDWSRVVIVTDPVWPNPMECLVGAADPFQLFSDLWNAIPECPKRACIHIGALSDPRFLACIPYDLPFFRVITLEYPCPSFVGRSVISSELAYLFGQPPKTSSCRMIPGRIHASNTKGRETAHPCPRKIEHLRGLIGVWTDPDDIILDPFCGSGTTLLAAQYWGREAIGIEVVPEFVEMTKTRLEANNLELWKEVAL